MEIKLPAWRTSEWKINSQPECQDTNIQWEIKRGLQGKMLWWSKWNLHLRNGVSQFWAGRGQSQNLDTFMFKSRKDLKLFYMLPLGTRWFQTLAKLGRALCEGNLSWGANLAEEQTAWFPFNLGEGLAWAGTAEWRILCHTQAGASPPGHKEKLGPAFDYWGSPSGELLGHQALICLFLSPLQHQKNKKGVTSVILSVFPLHSFPLPFPSLFFHTTPPPNHKKRWFRFQYAAFADGLAV